MHLGRGHTRGHPARSVVAGLGLSLVAGVACGYASVDGDPVTGGRSAPQQASNDPADDGGASFSRPSATAEAGTGPDGKPPSTTCAPSDLTLCFTFEGNASDRSLAPVTPSEASNIAFAAGKEDRAAVFGPASSLRFAPNPVFDLPADKATVEAWIKRENVGADAVVFDADGRFSLTINGAGKVWCKSSLGAVIGAKVVPVNQWAHVACVLDGGTMRAYLDGVEDASGAGGINAAPEKPAAIGGNAPSGEPFIGAIDSLRLFRSSRTAAEIAAAAR